MRIPRAAWKSGVKVTALEFLAAVISLVLLVAITSVASMIALCVGYVRGMGAMFVLGIVLAVMAETVLIAMIYALPGQPLHALANAIAILTLLVPPLFGFGLGVYVHKRLEAAGAAIPVQD